LIIALRLAFSSSIFDAAVNSKSGLLLRLGCEGMREDGGSTRQVGRMLLDYDPIK
jgi:hypothetical protein